MQAAEQRRFRVSVGSLMIAVAVCALVLAPVIWVTRQYALLRSERLRALEAAQRARMEAERALYAEQIQFAHAQSMLNAPVPADHPQGEMPPARRGGLWAAIGVAHAVFRRGEVKGLNVEFTLVNDGTATIDPRIAESRIVVNGMELADSGLILGSGPRDARFAALPPGEHLRLGCTLGDRLAEPGIYRLSWRGKNFQSPEVVFRVVPDKTD
jgi:hypothetical protein